MIAALKDGTGWPFSQTVDCNQHLADEQMVITYGAREIECDDVWI